MPVGPEDPVLSPTGVALSAKACASATFGVPEAIWSAAGMDAFLPRASSYICMIEPQGSPVLTVRLLDVRPPRRNAGVDGLVRARALRILAGFISGEEIPPIVVVDQPEGRFRYRVCDGFHRFHLSVTAGFTHIPVLVQDFWEPWLTGDER